VPVPEWAQGPVPASGRVPALVQVQARARVRVRVRVQVRASAPGLA